LVRGQPTEAVLRDPISKITRAKWTRGVAQVVEWLFCKHEALGSNLNPMKKKKKSNNFIESINTSD
jgi:hypothetical protein